MTVSTLIVLAFVVGLFAAFMLALGGASIWVALGERRVRTAERQARTATPRSRRATSDQTLAKAV